jgi:hypothetical protein
MHPVPQEILSAIFDAVSPDGRYDLKPLTLVNQHWRSVAAPRLLEHIQILDLQSMLKLCDLMIDMSKNKSVYCAIERYTKSIVLSTVRYEDAFDEEPEAATELDLHGRIQTISLDLVAECQYGSIINRGLSRLCNVGSLEWYGRFQDDHIIVSQLYELGIIRHLTYASGKAAEYYMRV